MLAANNLQILAKPKARISSRRWTELDDLRLTELRAAGKRAFEIAKVLTRTETAVTDRIGTLKRRKLLLSASVAVIAAVEQVFEKNL